MLRLETPRLILRPFEEAELEAFAAYRSDPDIARYQGWLAPYSHAQAVSFLAEMKALQPGIPGEWYQIAIERKGQAGLIGDCAFQVLADNPRQAEFGYTLARAHQKQGYATEAVKRLLEYLFDELNLHRVIAYCDVRNRPSIRLLEWIGMRREAYFVENSWFKGEWVSEYLYAMLQREWIKTLSTKSTKNH